MEVLRDYNQIVKRTLNALGYDISDTPMLDVMKDDELEYIANHSTINEKEIGELSELVFQLNDFVPALCNYIKIFLMKKNSEAVLEFVSKLYMGHIGVYNYQSKLKPYNMTERLFDRFVEIIKAGNIGIDLYLPLILNAIANEDDKIYVWHDIALEYMQNFMRENEDELSDFVENNPQYFIEFLELILRFNTQKGISVLFDDKSNEKVGEQNADKFLKQYISDTLSFFDKNLPENGDRRFHYIKVLSNIKNNNEVETRLENIYENEKDMSIREYLSDRLGISETMNLGSEKHFDVLARKKVEFVQERSLGVAFDTMPLHYISGDIVDNVAKTYLIDIFRNEKNLLTLSSFTSLYDIFNNEELSAFAQKLFEKLSSKDDILCAKWCVRMFSVLSRSIFERMVYEFLFALYNLGRNKEATYLARCLIYSKKPAFLEMFVRLNKFPAFTDLKDEFISSYAKQNSVSEEEIKDCLVGENLTDDDSYEKNRLYLNFISGRKYTKKVFTKLFIQNKTFNKFAQGLVFGEYKQGRLYTIFVVQGKELKYLYGASASSEDNEWYVSIVHQLDLDERFENIDLHLENPTFMQFRTSSFDVKSLNKTNLTFASLYGTIVIGEKFIQNMSKEGFLPNKNDYEVEFSSIYDKNEILNLLVEVEFQRPITKISPVATLGNIRFYSLKDTMKENDRYIFNKSQSLCLGGIPQRYFDYVLYAIQKAIKEQN